MKRTTRILAIAATLVFLMAGCNIFFPAKDDNGTPTPTGPTFTGAITITGTEAPAISAIKVGIFENKPDGGNEYNWLNATGEIEPLGALTPIKRGTISGSTHTTTFPVFSTLSTNASDSWSMIAWHDANSDGLLDTDEYNTMATVTASAGAPEGDPQPYFFSYMIYNDASTAYRFKYYLPGDGNTEYEVDPATLTSTAGFDFNMDF